MKRIVLSLAFTTAFLMLSSVHAFAARGDLIDPANVRNSIRISVGQEFAVAFDQRGERLTNPRRVQSAQKRPVVTLRFFVPPDHKDLLVLIVGSSYPRIVRYRAAARARGYRDFYETQPQPSSVRGLERPLR